MKTVNLVSQSILCACFCLLSLGGLSQEITIEQTFSHDTVFRPFTSPAQVYGITVNGSYNLLSDSSLIRLVIVDTYGNHFLLYEVYPLITDTMMYDFSAVCDETCFLNGVIPDSLRIDIINAFVTVKYVTLRLDPIEKADSLQATAK